MTNRQKFVESYARRMRTHSDANPGLYVVPASWTELAEKMTDGLIAGRANISTVLRAALKEMGAEPTYKGAKDYLTSDTPGDILSHD